MTRDDASSPNGYNKNQNEEEEVDNETKATTQPISQNQMGEKKEKTTPNYAQHHIEQRIWVERTGERERRGKKNQIFVNVLFFNTFKCKRSFAVLPSRVFAQKNGRIECRNGQQKRM